MIVISIIGAINDLLKLSNIFHLYKDDNLLENNHPISCQSPLTHLLSLEQLDIYVDG